MKNEEGRKYEWAELGDVDSISLVAMGYRLPRPGPFPG